jgi:hypothetical protein
VASVHFRSEESLEKRCHFALEGPGFSREMNSKNRLRRKTALRCSQFFTARLGAGVAPVVFVS